MFYTGTDTKIFSQVHFFLTSLLAGQLFCVYRHFSSISWLFMIHSELKFLWYFYHGQEITACAVSLIISSLIQLLKYTTFLIWEWYFFPTVNSACTLVNNIMLCTQFSRLLLPNVTSVQDARLGLTVRYVAKKAAQLTG